MKFQWLFTIIYNKKCVIIVHLARYYDFYFYFFILQTEGSHGGVETNLTNANIILLIHPKSRVRHWKSGMSFGYNIYKVFIET